MHFLNVQVKTTCVIQQTNLAHVQQINKPDIPSSLQTEPQVTHERRYEICIDNLYSRPYSMCMF